MAPSRIRLILCPALAAAALITATAPAAAAADQLPAGTVAISRACYVNTAKALAQITVTGSGWQAGSTIELTDKLGRISATTTAGPTGTFSYAVSAPVVDPYKGQQISDAIVASYEGSPGLPQDTGAGASSTPFLTTNFSVLQSGNKKNFRQKTIFELSGFTPNRTVYAHYLTRAGRLLKTVSFGKPTGACGLRRVVTYEYPGGHPQKGSYTVQFDNATGYRKLTQPQYRFSFQVLTA
jgi:hypothetical protein